MVENVGNHEADEGEEKISWAEQGKRAGLIQSIAPLLQPGEAGDRLLELGGVTGCLSLPLFPHPLFHPSRIPGLSVVLNPVLAGLRMWMVGFTLRKQNKKAMQIESFGYGFAFALGMALMRFFFFRVI